MKSLMLSLNNFFHIHHYKWDGCGFVYSVNILGQYSATIVCECECGSKRCITVADFDLANFANTLIGYGVDVNSETINKLKEMSK